jgi:acyl-CoA thioesterase
MSYIEKIRTSGRDANPFFRLMDIDVIAISEGKAKLRMNVRRDMLNGENFLQGGMFTALADEAMVLGIYSLLDEGQTIATVSESTSFMFGAGAGSVLIADGSVIKKGRRIVFAEGLVRIEGKDEVASRTSAAFAIIKRERE